MPFLSSPLWLASFFSLFFFAWGIFLPFWALWLEGEGLTAGQIGLVLGTGLFLRCIASLLIVPRVKKESQLPIRHWNPRSYQCTWHDGPLLRQVRASKMRETWSQQDPERVNRAFLPEDQRIPIFPRQIAKHPNSLSTSPAATTARPTTR